MTTTFSVPDMHCGKCRAKIEDAILHRARQLRVQDINL